MADMTTIKGRIAETIYPNGTGAITAESHQALLLEMVDNINEVKQDVLVSGQNIRPLTSGESLLGDNALAVLGTRFIYELENQKLFAMIDGALQDLDPWMVNMAVHSQVAQVIEIQKEGLFQELVPLTIKNVAGSATLCWEYDGMIYEASMEDNVLTVVSKPKGDDFDKQGTYPSMRVGTADDLAGRGESVPASFGFRASGGKSIKDGRAYIKRIKGNSVVWNQQVKHESRTEGSCSSAWDGDVITIDGLSTQSYYSIMQSRIPCVLNEKFLIIAEEVANPNNLSFSVGLLNAVQGRATLGGGNTFSAVIGNSITTVESGFGIDKFGGAGTDLTGIRFKVRVINLTKMFQAGNEPSTIEDYNARKPIVEDEYAYNEGQVIHCNTESIKSVGDNAWDEEWRNGMYQGLTGIFTENTKNVCNVTPIRILPNESYICNSTAESYAFFYDKDMNFINYVGMYRGKFTTPSNAYYMNFYFMSAYGNTYNHDIMIRLDHSGWKTEVLPDYQPYWQDTLPLPIIRKYFPQGMKSAGTAHDEIRYNKASGKWEYSKGKIKSVDMGDMEWSYDSANQVFTSYTIMDLMTHPAEVSERNKGLLCSKYSPSSTYIALTMDDKSWLRIPKSVTIKDTSYTDAATFKAAMSGVMLYYEAADWKWEKLDAEDQNFRDYYNVADFGTEEAIPATDAEGNIIPSAAFSADIIYQFNAVDMIREHEIEITELQNVIATMQAQLTSLINGVA